MEEKRKRGNEKAVNGEEKEINGRKRLFKKRKKWSKKRVQEQQTETEGRINESDFSTAFCTEFHHYRNLISLPQN